MQTFIFHIPHASTVIPDHTNFVVDKVNKELELLTDHAVDEMFAIDGITKVIFPYSRIFCDVERLDDEKEEMARFGGYAVKINTPFAGTIVPLKHYKKNNVFETFNL